MRVGDLLVSVDGKDVQGASLAVALSAIEAARRRVSRVESSGFSSEASRGDGEVLLLWRAGGG